MENFYQYVGIAICYLSLILGLCILLFYSLDKSMTFLAHRFKSLYIMIEYALYRKDFKKYMEESKRERHPKLKDHIECEMGANTSVPIKEKKDCPMCEGSGEVQQTDIDFDECRHCNGTGKI